jgi:hypothetical protein
MATTGIVSRLCFQPVESVPGVPKKSTLV